MFFSERTGLQKLLLLKAAAGGSVVEDTATGNPLTFLTDLAKPLKSLVANFLPVQTGSGDPSPENVRPITGWTGLNVMHGADQTDYDTYPVTWSSEGTVYGGYVDLVTGEVWKTVEIVEYDGSQEEAWEKVSSGSASAFAMTINKSGFNKNNPKLIANYLKTIAKNVTWGNYDKWISYGDSNFVTGIRSITSVDDWKAYLAENPLTVAYELASPVLITTLTPSQITAIKGNNTIWSDANGDCSVTYKKKG